MITIDRDAAKAAGYTDQEIDAFVSQSDSLPSVTATPPEPIKIDTQAAIKAGYTPEEINAFVNNKPQSLPNIDPVEITQTFGQPSEYDVFSGGVNTGVDYATGLDTPVDLPEGEWEIEDAYTNAQPGTGYIGNGENSGYGNSVVARNRLTGEKLRLSHLNKVDVQPGQVIKGGRIGYSGLTGNTSGSHLDLEYTDATGQMGDVLSTPYGNIIPHK